MLPYCTDNGIEFFIDFNGKTAIVKAFIQDESIYFITKEELREMALTAKVYGISKVYLHTNYGLELHSKYESAKTVGFDKIVKAIN
jgi:dissimilatory sulfite reductase (desulfoviridin) alpha/beta subunit